MRPNIARVAMVVSLGIATLAYGALDKHVTVRVEGRPIAVRTYGGTVADVLARAGVRVGPNDRVIPDPSAPVRDAQTIEVRRAKPITVLLDGKPRRVIVTGLTIQEVLHEIELRGTMADRVRPSRASRVAAGMTISYNRALAIEVVHDGKREQVVTNAPTVGHVVRELGIRLGKRDRLVPKANEAPRPGMKVRVLRVGVRREVEHVSLPYHTILRRDRRLEYGERKVLRAGSPGSQRLEYKVRYVDGEVVSRTLVDVTTTRAPRDRIVAVGAGAKDCSCTRGAQSGKATWYRQADGLTAAHRTLPFGTVVRVVNAATGKSVTVTIRDRGPFSDDRIIDLSDEAFRRIAPLSAGVIRVRIHW